MRAGWYERTGPAETVIQGGDMTTPEPGPGEVLVRVHASGINPSDYKRRGNVAVPPEFPRVTPHSDGAGVVAALGQGATRFRVGDRVWVYNAQWARPFGTAAEFVSLAERFVRPLPAKTSFVEGACFGIPAMTAYHAIHVGRPVEGKTIYVPGATGRVGAYAVQFAKWRGARVIASSGDAAGRDALAGLGADVVLDRKAGDLEARILDATQGRGVDRIVEVDLVGGLPLDERILAEGGDLVSFGAASAPKVALSMSGRRARNMSLHFIFVYLLDPVAAEATCRGIEEAEAAGALKHRIGGVFPLAELARAHRAAETASGTGHVVVEI